MFPAAALSFLRCPVCGTGFSVADHSLRCETGHSYDIARQGYVNLLPGDARPGTADTADMVAAREGFLESGHFAGLRRLIAEAAGRAVAEAGGGSGAGAGGSDAAGGCIVEVGAGTGYYLAGVLDHLPGAVGLALDISKFAARRAARAHERMAAVVCDAWKALPITDGAADLVLDVFAPRNPAEFRRILRPDGRLLVVTPTAGHLRELVAALGLVTVDERKAERLEQALGADFAPVSSEGYEELLLLGAAEAAAVVEMGPSARHLSADELRTRLAALGGPLTATLSVTVATYSPRTP